MENLNKNSQKTAVILCGGKGTRLGAIGKKTPKALVKIQGKEILWYIIQSLSQNGFKKIILPLGYKAKKIQDFIEKNFKNYKVEVVCSNTGLNTNIGERISKILSLIESKNFILLNGDAIFDLNLKNFFKNHSENNSNITFLSGVITYPYGTIGVKKNTIVDFKRNLEYDAIKMRGSLNYTAYNFTGIAIIKKHLIHENLKLIINSNNFEQDFYPKIIKKKRVNIIKITGFWHSIDNVKDINMVNKNFEKKFKKLKKLKNKLLKYVNK